MKKAQIQQIAKLFGFTLKTGSHYYLALDEFTLCMYHFKGSKEETGWKLDIYDEEQEVTKSIDKPQDMIIAIIKEVQDRTNVKNKEKQVHRLQDLIRRVRYE